LERPKEGNSVIRIEKQDLRRKRGCRKRRVKNFLPKKACQIIGQLVDIVTLEKNHSKRQARKQWGEWCEVEKRGG